MKTSATKLTLQAARLSATISTGFTATTADGKPARLAVIDEQGNVIEAGDHVAWAAWTLCQQVQENFWQGQGHLVVHASPDQAGESPCDKAA